MGKILQIDYEKRADKFLAKNNIPSEEIFDLIKKAVRKINGKEENIDLKMLRGKLLGLFRIRRGDLRIIFNYSDSGKTIIVTVVNIDYRGSVYE
ncbi:MAG: hypothetical protein K9J16_15190 [Melioribacteraceae bacterium]|nr:hypothetical protein [Melioribacteraceae bacterium]MCF8353071.1 hypothetical protein [Melioribacteraceae bacterium]MCF8392783.1 hypothetical protein [Melioribacteraceae bacterium]MCF8418314.1 hypothetical protein [Melioribacteraceae bacterium]